MTSVRIEISLDREAKKVLERRAKRELLTLEELISDILRRSVLSYKGNPASSDRNDDAFITYFSRRNKAKKRK